MDGHSRGQLVRQPGNLHHELVLRVQPAVPEAQVRGLVGPQREAPPEEPLAERAAQSPLQYALGGSRGVSSTFERLLGRLASHPGARAGG